MIQTPKNCYHCTWSDYGHFGSGKKHLVCKRRIRHIKVRKNQAACHEYRPMAKSAEICRCTQCQKLLEEPAVQLPLF